MKKVPTKPIFARYEYHADAVGVETSPLFDRKYDAYVRPERTIRMGGLFLKPKQVVHLLHMPDAKPTEDCPEPIVRLPRYTLCKDRNENNISIDNVVGADQSRRWGDGPRKAQARAALDEDGRIVRVAKPKASDGDPSILANPAYRQEALATATPAAPPTATAVPHTAPTIPEYTPDKTFPFRRRERAFDASSNGAATSLGWIEELENELPAPQVQQPNPPVQQYKPSNHNMSEEVKQELQGWLDDWGDDE